MITLEEKIAERVLGILKLLDPAPERDGLKDTPMRVAKALIEMTSGYGEKPADILSKTFEETSNQVVILRGIRFTSLCEHHLLPFMGTADIGYLPSKKVVGISKLARIVECYAKRLQIQERMTREIADAIAQHTDAAAVAVTLSAHHQCMSCRGVKQSETVMVTSSMLGGFRDNAALRAEFFSLTQK